MKIAASNVSGQSASMRASYRSSAESIEAYEDGQLVQSQTRTEQARKEQSGSLFLLNRKNSFMPFSSIHVDEMGNVKPKSQRELLGELEEFRFKTLQAVFQMLRRQFAPFKNVYSDQDGGLSYQAPNGGAAFRYQAEQTRYEYERMDFEMKGTAVTEDGRKIDFGVALSMSREFYEKSGFTLEAGAFGAPNTEDPLMIQLSGTPSLSETKFSFDLDMDGTPDQISFAGNGSGFLALDKNEDGTINDGSELFGPTKGNGFEELGAYDSDKNGWIDENDPIFDKLRVWTKDENGKDRLFALGEAGVGAIYLGHSDTAFNMKDSQGELQGVMRSSGMFFFEDGRVGTMHQIDLVN
jgi:hypothetical protein